jgi:hypothetical protein
MRIRVRIRNTAYKFIIKQELGTFIARPPCDRPCRGSELPQQILPTAQRLLDELLSGAQSLEINTVSGAPDPTAGGSVGEQSAWCLDSKNLRDNIKKILIKVYRGPYITDRELQCCQLADCSAA